MTEGRSGSESQASPDPGGRLRDVIQYYRTVAPVIDREPARSGELSFWRREVSRTDPGPVLELGCGTGRITAELASRSRRVVGVDLSPEMLRRARGRLAGEASVRLVRGDVCRLPVAEGWELAVAADGLFSHLVSDGDRQAALKEIARVLVTSGRFLLEGLWLPRPVFRAASREGWTRARPLDRPEAGALEVIRERWRCDPDTRICRVRFEYGPDGAPPEITAGFEARVWGEREVVERLQSVGLRIRHRWGDFERRQFSPEESRRLIVVAERS